MSDPRVEANINRKYAAQQELGHALDADPRRIRKMKNVIDLGVGFHWKKGRRTQTIGPVVLVRKKVPRSKLSAKDRVPTNLKFKGRTYRIDVIQTGDFALACSTGIADDQNKNYTSIPPGVALCSVVNGATPPAGQGSSGAILKIVAVPQPPARYVLTCQHVVGKNQDWAQTWTTHPIMGTCIDTTQNAALDASVLETQFYLLDVHCLDTKQKEPIPPLAGMRVMKSGPGSGLTGSIVVAVTPQDMVYIDNDPLVPKSIPAIPEVYTKHGDSGSVSWLGTPPDPRDATVDPLILGNPIDNAIAPVVNLEAPANRAAKRTQLLKEYRGRAVSLNAAVGAVGGPVPVGAPTRFALGASVQSILADLTAKLAKPVVISDD